MRHARDPDEFLEIPRDELRPVVGDDPRPCVRILLFGCLQDDLDLSLRHRLAQGPMDDRPAVAVQHTAQIVERATDVDIGNVDVPVFMRLQGLLETGALLRKLPFPLRQQSSLAQHSPHAGRAHRHDVGIEHHERQAPIALQRILQMEIDDRLLLPFLQPEVPGHPTVVLVRFAISFPPLVELAGCDAEPPDEPSDADLRLLRPASDVIHDLIPHVVRYPDPV